MTESKIIIDEDWKAQVQAEKETAEKEAAEKEAAEKKAAERPEAKQRSPTAEPQAPASSETAVGDEDVLPPATLSSLIVSLAAQAWMTLGQIPDPRTGKGEVHLP